MNTIISLSDQQLIEGLLVGGIREHQSLKFLYSTHRKKILGYVQKNQGNETEAEDIFQEGILILYKQIRQGKFRGESKISTYLYGICRYLWLNKLKERKSMLVARSDSFGLEEDRDSLDPYRSVFQKEEREEIYGLFAQLKHQCKEVLTLAFFDEYSMEVIAQKLGYDNAQIARNKKYKCLKRLKKYLNEQPTVMKRLRELHS